MNPTPTALIYKAVPSTNDAFIVSCTSISIPCFYLRISRRVPSVSNSRCDRHDDTSALHLDDSRSATNSPDKITICVSSLVTKLAYRPCKLIFRPSLCLRMLSTILLGAFAKLRKATISFVMSCACLFVRPSTSMAQLGSHCSDAQDNDIRDFAFEKPVKRVCLYEDVTCLGVSFAA